jgi:hypothetical protein
MTREEMGNDEIVGCDEGFERGEETGGGGECDT